jgi:hypothetical protein
MRRSPCRTRCELPRSQGSSCALLLLSYTSPVIPNLPSLNLLHSTMFCLPLRLLGRRPLIQQTQIRLPPNRNNTRKNAPILLRYIRKAKCRNSRPHFTTIDPARRHRILYALDDLWESCAGEQGLHAEEVRVEEGREEGLVYYDL